MKKVGMVLLLLVLVVGGVWIFEIIREGSKEDSDIIRVSGNIEITDAEVSFKIPGRVVERLVSEGERSEVGQVVARLDSEELAQEVALREAEVRAAQATLDELEAGSRPEEISQAEAVVRRAQAEVKYLKADYDRKRQLFQTNMISAREYDAARSAYEATQARVEEAEEQLRLLKAGPRKEKIELARAQLEKAEQALALAKTRLSYAILEAPLSGMVLSENVEPGEYVAPGTPVITIGNLQDVWLRAYINETDLGRVKLGQKVYVTTDTYPGKRYEGRVSFIASEAEFTPRNVQTQEQRVKLVYRVKIDVPNPNMELKPGMPADAQILTVGGN